MSSDASVIGKPSLFYLLFETSFAYLILSSGTLATKLDLWSGITTIFIGLGSLYDSIPSVFGLFFGFVHVIALAFVILWIAQLISGVSPFS